VFWVELHNILLILASFLFFLFSIFLFAYKRGNKLRHGILAAFLFSHAILLFDRIMYHYHVESFCPHLLSIGWPFLYLFSPMMYLYTKSVTERGFALRLRHCVHVLPFLFLLTYAAFAFYPLPAGQKARLIAPCTTMPPLGKILFFSLVEVQFFLYAGFSLIQLGGYRKKIKECCSSMDTVQLSWLSFVLYGFIAWRIIFVGMRYLTGAFLSLNHEIIMTCVDFGFFVFACAFIWKGLRQPNVFAGIEESSEGVKYKKSLMTKSEKKDYKKKLLICMESKRPYLIPALTIVDLAKELDISSKNLSQLINETFRMNFYRFVNSYRIEAAKRMMSSAFDPKTTILEVLYEAGFNSKSSFNRMFKEQTGITPSQYIKTIQKTV
jgi:AraC-like DNA-binding protein